ncbi:MAG TPA: hypothetical protein VJ552_03300 [Sediminibacterium sp.]|nr:hypothetical protein [Sediminibacterium sp.]
MHPSPETTRLIRQNLSSNMSFRVLQHEYSYIGGRKSSVYANNGNRMVQGNETEILLGLLPVYGNKLECVGLDFYNNANEDAADRDNRLLTKLELAYQLLQDEGILFAVTDTALYKHLLSAMELVYGNGCGIADFTNSLYNGEAWMVQHLLIFHKGGMGESGMGHIKDCFSGKRFQNILPADLIQHCMYVACSKNALLLNAICGYDTMAAPVLQLNKLDKGNRRFLLLYPMNASDDYTTGQLMLALETDFDCYRPGETLFTGESSRQLNTLLPVKHLREYIWYTETGTGFTDNLFSPAEPYLLGIREDTAIYFMYEYNADTLLDQDFLLTMQADARQFIVYAHQCAVPAECLQKRRIRFKQIPEDISSNIEPVSSHKRSKT